VSENGRWNVPGLGLNSELKLAIVDMLIPRERLSLGRAIGKGRLFNTVCAVRINTITII